jgi:hypothetical protein
LERGIAVRQGFRSLRAGLSDILTARSDVLSPHIVRLIGDLASDWRRLDEVSKRGNRYLRVLFVQAAWVVLIKPKNWERHGLRAWIEAAKKTTASQRAGDRTREQAGSHRPGRHWPRVATTRAGASIMQSPSPRNPCTVLGAVKTAARRLRRWPAASLDRPYARSPSDPGRDEETAIGTNKGTMQMKMIR